MKTPIEQFTSLTGWSGDGSITAEALNYHRDYIAGDNPSSVIFDVPSGNTGKYIQKTLAMDLTGYDVIVFSVSSREKAGGPFRKPSDYAYKLNLVAAGEEYYIPIYQGLSHVTVKIPSGLSMTRIRITALHDDADKLVLSHMVAVLEELPVDLMSAIKDALDAEVLDTLGDGYLVGPTKEPLFVGDLFFTMEGTNPWLVEGAVVKIKDGATEETHYILRNDEDRYYFGTIFNGEAVLNNFADPIIYLQFPVIYGSHHQYELLLPSCSIWGITPEPVERGSSNEDWWDTHQVSDGAIMTRREPRIYKFSFVASITSRHYETLSVMAYILRKFLGKEKLWVNGVRVEPRMEGVPTEVEPMEAVDILPQVNYTFSVEFKEELWARTEEKKILTTNLEVEIQ